ncbi:hypothetical protein [Nostoc sp. CCY 9925]|uniref:hypothetical protein n=1 Tax=Nostoc sp. CCY 9925 TaxID=3103865 RepID=UPI0039C677A3
MLPANHEDVKLTKKLLALKGDIKYIESINFREIFVRQNSTHNRELKLLEQSIQLGESYGKYHWNQR